MKNKIAVYVDELGVLGVHVPKIKDEAAEVVAQRFAILRRIAPVIRKFDEDLKKQ